MSGTWAVVCPGQGAQRVGMGADVAARWPAARQVFERASDVLGLDLLAVCQAGPAEALVRTDLQQPAILTVGVAVHEALRAQGGLADEDVGAAFGLSLGEFTALVVAGALDLEDAVGLVRERGLGMQEASEAVPSGLTALRCDAETAERLCADAREQTGGVCSVANVNAPDQMVISGDLPSLDAAESLAKERGVRRPTRLPVAGAFHSVLMAPGARRLERALEGVTLRAPRVPVISNVTAKPTVDPPTLRANLVAQVTSPVRFVDCVRAARSLGVAATLELGPGKVLSALIRRTDPELETQAAETADEIVARSDRGTATGETR